MPSISGEQAIATILKHDNKTTSYKIALLRAINDLVLLYPGLARAGLPVAVPLPRLAELWTAYYWPFADNAQPIYQGARALVSGQLRNDVSFRPALTRLRQQWHDTVQLPAQAADGFFLLTEMRTPRRRATYAPALQQAYTQAVAAAKALLMPIKYAGPGHWTVFDKPARLDQLPPHLGAHPGGYSAPRKRPLRLSLDAEAPYPAPALRPRPPAAPTVYPVNELWNLLPVDRQFNQHTKRDRVPDAQRLATAEPLLAQAYATYQQSASLHRVMHEDAALRFTSLPPGPAFPAQLAARAIHFIDDVAAARYVQRF